MQMHLLMALLQWCDEFAVGAFEQLAVAVRSDADVHAALYEL